jgi:23S rRNA (guanine2445-N2)-methyltransferase / 23S rRNA (guanine2069-N7)-methyltransferase
MNLSFFATTPKGIEPLLADELAALGASAIQITRAGAAFEGTLEIGYRACLWSRVASRILLTLTQFPAASPEALYAGIREIRWDEHLSPEGTLAVDFTTAQSQITHSHFGALKVKDAIVDQFRENYGIRPSVRIERPDLRVNVYLYKNRARISLDLAGDSLHRRGYREEGLQAPLKENLAAAILLYAGWPTLAADGAPLLDLMCGSGTLPIEAALMAADIAPGLLRPYFGFSGWRGHDASLWERLLAEARARKQLDRLPPVVGYDSDRRAVKAAFANVERVGLRGAVHIERRELAGARPVGQRPGLVVVNPPYGERMGDTVTLPRLYGELGEVLRRHFGDWRAAVFTGNPDLIHRLRLRAESTRTLYNGKLTCELSNFEIPPAQTPINPTVTPRIDKAITPPAQTQAADDVHVEMFANRLRKNLKTLGRWARREGIDCYRLYDADLPEYALAIDLYPGEKLWVHVQEYQAPASIDPGRAELRLNAALAVIPEVLEIPPEQVFFKVRRRQKGDAQYQKLDAVARFYPVREGRCRFLVNFTDYLDTGLFLDHRPTRAMILELAQGKRFLNLFGYTGTASVCAALGGATDTTTVDMSNTYLDWTRRNLELNGITGYPHRLIRADCLEWLDDEARQAGLNGTYDLIFLDPPTFSNSKRMEETFDVQRDHLDLLRKTARLLRPDGLLIFSTNRRRFRLDRAALTHLSVEDISAATIPQDFARHRDIHHCWKIRRA